MGGASGDVGQIALPSGGGAYPTQTSNMPMIDMNSGYRPPALNTVARPLPEYVENWKTPEGLVTDTSTSKMAPGGGLLAPTEAYKGFNDQDWINSHIDEIVKAAEWKKADANKLTSMGYYNTGPSGGGYAARDTWGGDVWKSAKGKYFWDKEGKLAIPDDVRQRLIGLK